MNDRSRTFCCILSALMVLALAGCGADPAAELPDPTVTVETTVAETGSLSKEGVYIGTVSSEGTSSVTPMVSGTVKDIFVSVGDSVTAGELLCTIDNEPARLTLKNAQAGYDSALAGVSSAQAGAESANAGVKQAQVAVDMAKESYRAALAQYGGSEGSDALPTLETQVRMAEDNYNNTKMLFDIGAAAQIEVDQAYQSMLSAQAGLEAARIQISTALKSVQQAEAALASAQAGAGSAAVGEQSALAGVASARVGVDSAEYQLSLYNITAPISGVVESINVTKDNFAPSGSIAFVISNGKNKTITFYVTDVARKNLAEGQSVVITSNQTNYPGVISAVSGIVDPATGMFQVKALTDDVQDLPDGLSVSVAATANETKEAIIIPSDALYFDMGVSYVYLVRDEAAVRTEVNIALYTEQSTAVTEGLSEGDIVITSWSSTLRDGVPVHIAD